MKHSSTQLPAFQDISIGLLVVSFFMKNSYLFTLILSFWISLYTANIIHIFLLFFTVLFIIKEEKNQNQANQISFRNRYWIWLIIYLDVVIMLKYVYSLDVIAIRSKEVQDYVELLGLRHNYKVIAGDFGSLMIFWVLYIFVVLQYETYKSDTYKQYSRNYSIIMREHPLFTNHLRFFNCLYFYISFFYYKFIIWLSYFIILIVILTQSYCIINTLELFLILLIFYHHINLIE